jgi:carboxylesterase
MPLLPGAEPFSHQGGPVGVLVCHGFTGSPQSMRPWAEHAAERGLTVSLPLLPGHGTDWREMNATRWPDWYAEVDRAFARLSERCEKVFAFGLSMGGALCLHLAAQRGPEVAGLVLVNPAVKMPSAVQAAALPVLRHLVPSVPGLTDDIARPGRLEGGYDRTPLHAAYSTGQLFRTVRGELPRVTQPLLLFRSRVDHVVPGASSDHVLAHAGSRDVTERTLERSYHVATLDHDAEQIFEASWEFVRRLAPEAKEPERA